MQGRKLSVLLMIAAASVRCGAKLPELIVDALPDYDKVEGSGDGATNDGIESLLEGSGIQADELFNNVTVASNATAVSTTTHVPMLEEVERSIEAEEVEQSRQPEQRPPVRQVSCKMDVSQVPANAWLRPYRESPMLVYGLPQTMYRVFPPRTLLIVDLGQCWPLAVTHADGCMEVKFSGNYPLKCVSGYFRHGLRPKHKVRAVHCGHC